MTTGAYRSANATVSAHGAVAVTTPSDSTELPITRALFIGTAGDVTVTMADGQVVEFLNIANATLLPIQVQKVMAATSASNILALY